MLSTNRLIYTSRRLASSLSKIPRFEGQFSSSNFKINFGTLQSRNLYQSNATGLFGIQELREPDGFHVLRAKAIKRADELVEQVIEASENARSQSKNENSKNCNRQVVEIFDELSNCLCKVADLAEFVRVSHPNSRYQATAEHASMAISSLVEKLNTDKRLYEAIKSALPSDEEKEQNYNEDEYVAKLFIFDFEQSGIHLDDTRRSIVLKLNENILRLGSIFTANANQPRVLHKSQLSSIDKKYLRIFPTINRDPDYVVINGLYADSEDEKLRELAYKLYLQIDDKQEKLLSELLDNRRTLAQLCGFKSYAHRAVKNSIIESPETIWDFLNILNHQIRPFAQHDYNQMLQFKNQTATEVMEGKHAKLNAWDVAYCSAKFKQNIYSEKIEKCLPYFSVKSCLEGLNMIFEHLYGMRMEQVPTEKGEIWHPDVMKFAIVKCDTRERFGLIYCDLFERIGKPHQDCHFTIRGGCYSRSEGTYQSPVVVLMLSLPNAVNEQQPALLSPSMVDNFFHEMGHAMHSMLARTKYQHITGTRCSTDLAEVPSIMMEFFASDARVVSKFARHYATNEVIPVDLLQSWIKSKRIFTASETQLQIFYAALDQAYHSENSIYKHTSLDSLKLTTTDVLKDIQKRYHSIDYIENTAWQLRFSHLVGYGAKYYAYLVSRSIAGAIWSKLFAHDPLSSRAGQQYQEEILRHGGGRPSKLLVEDVLNCKINADFIASSFIKSFQQYN